MRTYLLLILFFFQAFAHETITAVVPSNFPPHYILDKNNQPSGFAIEVLDIVSQKAGYDVNYIVKDDFSAVEDILLKNEADLIPNSGVTPERENNSLFTSPIETILIKAFKREHSFDIESLQDIKDKKIAVVKNNVGVKIIKQYPKELVIIKDTAKEALSALISSEVDLLIYPDNLIAILDQYNMRSRIVPLKKPLKEIKRAIRINKNKPLLAKKLNTELLKFLKTERFREIYAKWFGLNNITFNLTKEEKNYIKNKPYLTTQLQKNYQPYLFEKENIPKGYLVDIMSLISEKIDTKIKYIPSTSTQNYMKLLDENKIDFVSHYVFDKERENRFLRSAESNIDVNIGLIYKNTDQLDFYNLNGKKVGVVKGYHTYKVFSKNFPAVKLQTFNDNKELINAIKTNTIDAAVSNYGVLKYLIKTNSLVNEIKIELLNNEYFFTRKQYFAFNKNNTLLQSIIDKAYASISKEEINNLKNKWSINSVQNSPYALTRTELEFLKVKKEIKVCTRYNHYPISAQRNGKLIGITGDVFELLEEKLGVKFKAVGANSNNQFLENIKNNKCELIAFVKRGFQGFKEYKTADIPVIRQHLVAIGNINTLYVEDLETLQGKTFYVKDYPIQSNLKKQYPNLNIVLNNDINLIMKKVKNDTNSFLVQDSITANQLVQTYGSNQYKIINRFEKVKAYGTIAVHNNYSIFLNIINKTLHEIPPSTLSQIENNYKLKEFKIISYQWLWYVVGLLVFIVIIVQYSYTKKLKTYKNSLEEKVKEQTKELIEIIDNIPAMVYVKDAQTLNFIHFNKACENFLDRDKHDIIGKNDYDLFPKEFADKLTQKDQEVINKQITSQTEEELINKQGKRFILAKKTLLKNDRGEPKYLLGISQDITEQKVKDILLLEQAKMAALGDMIGNIAHQWRQPLNTISLNAAAIRLDIEFENISKEKLIEYASTINDNSIYLSNTIDTFRNFIKGDKEFKTLILQDEINEAILLIQDSLKSNNIELINNINNDQPIKLRMIHGELPQVLINIFNNAKDIIKQRNIKDGAIEVDLIQEDNKFIITVEDNGGGIPHSVLPHIFEPYYTTKHQSVGTGLGLHMSYKIITESFKGNLSAQNTQNGAKFFIELYTNS